MNKLFSFFFVLVFFSFAAFAQNPAMDSLRKVLTQYAETDTNYINTLNELAYKYYSINPDSTLLLANKGIAISEKNHYDKGKAEALRNKGIVFWLKGDYAQAMSMYLEALPIAEKIQYKKGIAHLYNNIAVIYYNKGKYTEALEKHLQALKIREEIGDKRGISASLNNMANVFGSQGKYQESLEKYLQSLKIDEELGDNQSIAISLNDIADIYSKQGKYEEALEKHLQALNIVEDIGDKQGIAQSLNHIALIYYNQGKYLEALEKNLQALKIFEKIGDKKGVIIAKNGLANSYCILSKYALALYHAHEALVIAQEIGNKDKIKGCNETLSKVYEAMGKYDKALLYYKDFKVVADSLNNKETEKKAANLQAQYEYDKKMAVAAAEQGKKDIEKEKELQEQRFQRNGFIAGLGVMILIALLIFRNLRKQTKAKKLLQAKNKEILEKNVALQEAQEEIRQQAEELLQNNEALNSANNKINEAFHVLNEQNEDIIASINAAQRIQQAMLPFESRINAVLPEHFILFMPRDIVSGDFYWLVEKEATKIIIVADCTGHGVPGALMSMIGMNLLEEIINTKNITEPDKILYHLHKDIHSALQHEKTEAKEGMDIAVVTYSPSPLIGVPNHPEGGILPDEGGILSYAGAMNPLYYVQNNELFEIKATKKAIGGQLFDLAERHYEKHEVILQVPTTIYLCTDGYQDQFGGEKGKKFMTKRLKELLLELSVQEMKQQGKILRQT